MRRALLLALGAIVLGGCAGAGTQAPVGVQPQALQLPYVYRGSLEIEGNRVSSTLRIQQTGAALTSRLTSVDLGMDAAGIGSVNGSEVDFMMAYGAACRGTARLVGRIAETTFDYTGRINASDCTGEAEGSFTFSPEPPR
ncbi:MAG: hypothetical protein BMS9Abin29_2232 [Gemmatimonadota bacterium]|nr:MAG: hypothetical protein BMS9Abin29_2232 [Gemmatimonadota bacterium]